MWESYRAKHNLTTTAPFASVVFFDQIMAEPNKTYTVKQNFQMGERLSAASSHCFYAVRHAVRIPWNTTNQAPNAWIELRIATTQARARWYGARRLSPFSSRLTR
jgi:hypothetical protein